VSVGLESGCEVPSGEDDRVGGVSGFVAEGGG
jgi:hypothetical protein